jgi:hypothetical protein
MFFFPSEYVAPEACRSAGSQVAVFILQPSQDHLVICSSCYINYLCTYDLYGLVRNVFDAGSIHYLGKWEGVGPWKSRVFWAL